MTNETMTKQPNLLIITSDQHRADCYGFAGRKVSTPHLDLLRQQGTWMRNCITPNVVCQPARASMLTGLLPLTHGVSDNGIDLDERFAKTGFASHLSQQGYRSAFIGKAHFSTYKTYAPTGRPECIESSAEYGPKWHGPYMGFDHVELMLIGHNWFLPEAPPRGLHYENWYHADGLGQKKNELYQTALPPLANTPQTFHSALPSEWHNTTWVTDRSVDYLRQHHQKADDKPFVLWASFPDPHHPFDAPQPWSRLHAPDDVDIPLHRKRDLERRPWWHRAALENAPQDKPGFSEVRQQYSRIPPLDDRQLRELTANYYGMISMIDDGVGRILKALQDSGEAENTIVIFTTDHGDWLGDHGLVLKGPMMYDGLMRVGAIVRGPGVPAGATITRPVSTLDLSATLADYAGGPSATGHGQSWRPLIEGAENLNRPDFALNEWALGAARCGVTLDLQTVRTERWRLTLECKSAAGEMYDLHNDPFELENLFDLATHRGEREALIERLALRPNDRLAVQPLPVGQA
jgi:arylsulfatase A-like enzyme